MIELAKLEDDHGHLLAKLNESRFLIRKITTDVGKLSEDELSEKDLSDLGETIDLSVHKIYENQAFMDRYVGENADALVFGKNFRVMPKLKIALNIYAGTYSKQKLIELSQTYKNIMKLLNDR